MTAPNAYTHGHHESVLRTHQWRTAQNSAAYLLPHLGPEVTLLDIGAGPGTITMDFAERVAHVTATEIGPRELALSRQTAQNRGVSNLSFAVEDVHALSFADGSFDVVHAHQVLQHVADPVLALREMARVTRPGGRLVVCEFSTPTNRLFATAYKEYLMQALPRVARAVSSNPDAYVYLAESIRAWPDQADLAHQMSSAGWSAVRWRNLTGGIVALHAAYKAPH
jgi:demethylmenaquinone methyltransferase/2-methoxy-6-polyprenyl-1,4-benzoquinol methylase